MSFNIGDKVIHSTHGFAEIVNIETKVVSGISLDYYVVKTNTLLLWIPVENNFQCNLRFPTPMNNFYMLSNILRSHCLPLSTLRNERKTQIHDRLTDGASESTCGIIRDLSFCRKSKKLNEYESSMFKRAVNMLIDEWQYTMSVTKMQATMELNALLDESYSISLAL
jgi:RNA polymerase-interacting CarD/CdnL/TRCF family regulator